MKSLKVVPFYYIALSKLGYVLKCGLSSTWTFWTPNNCFVKNFTGLHTDYNLEKATCVRLSAALLIVIQLCMVSKPDSKVKMTNLTSPCQMLELLKAQGIKSYDTLLVQHLLSFRRQYKDFYSGNYLLLTAYSLGCEARQNVSARIYLIFEKFLPCEGLSSSPLRC